MPWSPIKITVLKTTYDKDLAEQYRRADIPSGPCKFFTEGQEFIVELIGLTATGHGTTSKRLSSP
jgi:hypothetical protein